MSVTSNPYIGPRTFTRNEGHLFFGREREAQDLLGLIVSERLVLFYAQSGAGKSSLVNTRLIPSLESEDFEVLPIGRVSGDAPADVNVENIYIYNLLGSIIRSETIPDVLSRLSLRNFLAGLDKDENGYVFRGNSLLKTTGQSEEDKSRRLILIIDQFEELFSTHLEAWEKREDFFNQIAQAMHDHPTISIVLVMREDYIAQLDPYAYQLPGKLRTRYYMQRLGRDAALKAVTRPVEKVRPYAAGAAEKLVENITSIKVWKPNGTLEVRPGQYVEPVQLQVVCYSLWENLPPGGSQITEEDVRDVGDVNQSLENFYDERVSVVARMKNVPERMIRDWFDHELITSAGTRNMVLRDPNRTNTLDDTVIQAFQGDLIRAETRAGQIWYELSHDRLIEPIQASNAKWFSANLSIFQQQAALWVNQGRPDGLLLRGNSLEQALRQAETIAVSKDEVDFLAACTRARERELREKRRNSLVQILAIGAVIFLFVAIGLAFRSFASGKQAIEAKQAAQTAQVIAELQAAIANTQAAISTYSLGQVASLSGLAEAGDLAGQAQIALSQSGTIQLGRLLSVEAYNKNKLSGEILPSVYQALVTSIAEGNDLLLNPRPFASASFSFDGNGKRLLVDNSLWNLNDVQVSKLDTGQVVYSSFLSNEEVMIITPNTDFFSADQNPYDATIMNIVSQEKRQIQLTVPQSAHFLNITPSDNGRWVALMFGASKNGGIQLWDTQSPKQGPKQLLVPFPEVREAAISQDGTAIAIVDNSYLYLWQDDEIDKLPGTDLLTVDLKLDTGFAKGSLRGKSGRGLQFSPDGQWLAMQTENNVRVFDPKTQKLISGTEPLVKGEITGFLFSPDSKYLIYVIKTDQYTSVLRWSREDPGLKPYEMYRSTTADITAMDISINGRLIIGDEAGYARAWDINQDSRNPVVVPSVHAGEIVDILIGPDDATVISASEIDGTRLWNLTESGSEAFIEYRLPNTVSDITQSDNGNSLIISGIKTETGNGTVHIYSNLLSPIALDDLSFDSDLGSSLQAVADSNRWIAAGRTYQPHYYDTPSYFLDFWSRDAEGGNTSFVSFTLPSAASSLVFDPAGRYLVIAADTGEIWIDDTADLSRSLASATPTPENESAPTGLPMPHRMQLPNDLTGIQYLLFSQDARYLIGASAAGVRIWDTSKLNEGNLYQLSNAIAPIVIGPDQKHLATAGLDNTIQLYDLENLMSSPVVIPLERSFVTRLAFNQNGDRLAVANKLGQISIFQLPVTEYPVTPLYSFQGSSGEITSLEFGPEGAGGNWLIASSGLEVYLWNTDTPNNKPVILQSKDQVVYASFTNDGEWLIAASTDQTLRFVSMDLEKISYTACTYAGRNLTLAEWERYLSPEGALRATCPRLGYGLEQVRVIIESGNTPTPYATAAYLLSPQPLDPALTPTPPIEFVMYTLQEGDTLGLIAIKFGIDVNTLIRDNNITDPNLIVPGQTLKIRITNTPVSP